MYRNKYSFTNKKDESLLLLKTEEFPGWIGGMNIVEPSGMVLHIAYRKNGKNVYSRLVITFTCNLMHTMGGQFAYLKH